MPPIGIPLDNPMTAVDTPPTSLTFTATHRLVVLQRSRQNRERDMFNRSFARLVIVLSILAAAPMALAQNAGSLRGTVADKTGAIVPGASVVLTSESTKFSRETVTDARGAFFFASVESGSYGLKVSMNGFKTYEAKSVRVSANDSVGLDVALEVGAQTETIEVTASREMIRTETGARE